MPETKLATFHLYLYGPDQPGLGRASLPTSFEDAAQRLEQLEKLYFEPDGSFVWSFPKGEQVFGMLYDSAGKLQYVELQGKTSLQTFRDIVDAIACGDRNLTTVTLPSGQVQDLQSFEAMVWNRDACVEL
jgi:hypothetical protein